MRKIINGIYTAEDVATRLDQHRSDGKGGWSACCPAHEDRTPSLSINDGNDGIVVYCHAGCDQRSVVMALQAMGAWPVFEKKQQAPAPEKKAGKIKDCYDYKTETGELLFQVVRFEPKDFRQRCPDPLAAGGWKWSIKHLKQLVPYRLPELLASDIKKWIFIVEGEKDANNLAKLGVTVTTFAQGAGKWRTEYTQWFQGRNVCILPDNDDPGRAHAELIAENIHGVAADIKILNLPDLPPKGDVSDWLEAPGNDKPKLGKLITAAQPWRPAAPPEITVQAPQTGGGVVATKYGHIDWPDQTDKGRALSTIRNVQKLLEIYGVTARYNVVKKDIEINIPGSVYTLDNASSCAMAELRSMAATHKLPTADIPEFVSYLADQNAYNPVAAWIDSKPWDGKNRFPDLVASLDPDDTKAASMLLWRWLLAAVAAVMNPDGVAAGGVLVLQGEQYIGKTSWFWSLTNKNRELAREGAILNPADKDSVMQCLSYWLVELGELDATFRRADIAALKAFITRDYDQLRRPYARGDSRYPRRTVFAASVNTREYLHDETGNRRYWTIGCGPGMNSNHGVDMQQLWAQVANEWRKGARHLLTKEEVSLLNQRNEDYSSADPIEDIIRGHYDWSDMMGLEPKTATEILLEIGYEKPTKLHKNAAAAALKKLTGSESVRSTGGRRVYMVPRKRFEA